MRVVLLGLILVLASCKGIGISHLDTGGYATPAGISHLDSHSPDAKDDAWLNSFYGGSHGWGWGGEEEDANCSFYATCQSSGRDDNIHNNSISDW